MIVFRNQIHDKNFDQSNAGEIEIAAPLNSNKAGIKKLTKCHLLYCCRAANRTQTMVMMCIPIDYHQKFTLRKHAY